MKRILSFTIISIAALSIPVLADNQPDAANIRIVELQTASLSSATDEFVEIYNADLETAELDGWQLQYKSASGDNWLTKAQLEGQMLGRSRLLIATEPFETVFSMSGGFAAAGGHIQLIDQNDQTIDLLGWGTAAQPSGSAAPLPQKGESLKRYFDEDGFIGDFADNSTDFFVSTTPTPYFDDYQHDSGPVDPGETTPPPVSEEPDDNNQSSSGSGNPSDDKPAQSHDMLITELFVNPDKPLTDADDEFVELFNPNSFAVNLEGYEVQTGSNYSYSYVLPKASIGPQKYLPLFSIDTNLTLSNTSGRARIVGPDGRILHESANYEKAKAGESWALISKTWLWSSIPTPGQANSTAASDTSDASTGLSDRSALIGQSTATGSSGSPDRIAARNIFSEPESEASTELNKTVLAGVGSMALLYAGYEYRHDFGNRINQLRRYLEARRQNWGQAEGRRSHRIGQRLRRWKDSLRTRISQGLGKFRSSG